jgi:hypothetical protein
MYKYNIKGELIANCEQTFDSFCDALSRFTKNTFGFTKFKIFSFEMNKTIADNF